MPHWRIGKVWQKDEDVNILGLTIYGRRPRNEDETPARDVMREGSEKGEKEGGGRDELLFGSTGKELSVKGVVCMITISVVFIYVGNMDPRFRCSPPPLRRQWGNILNSVNQLT